MRKATWRQNNRWDSLKSSAREQAISLTRNSPRLRNIADGRQEVVSVDVTEPSFDPWDAQKDIEEAKQDPKIFFPGENPEEERHRKTIKHKPISLAASGKAYTSSQETRRRF